MSLLQHALDLFEYKSMEDVTVESLKKTFKKQVVTSHPDKGGSEADFDMLLSTYLYLSETVNRLSGGRNTLHDVNAPDRIKEERANQLINEIFEEFEQDRLNTLFNNIELHVDTKYTRVKLDNAFHEQFEKTHTRDNGYGEWFKMKDESTLENNENSLYGSITIKPDIVNENELNSAFEATIVANKPTPTTLSLQPDEMAYYSGGMGMTLIEENAGFTSVHGMNPEYTDLYTAYTSDNTVFDKIQPIYTKVDEKPKTVEELLQEREKVYEFYKDEELEAITEYEKKRFEADKKHKNNIHNYFNSSVKVLKNTVEDTVENKDDNGVKSMVEDTVENTVENEVKSPLKDTVEYVEEYGFCIMIRK